MSIPEHKARQILFVLASGYLPERITGANISLHALCERLAAGGGKPVVVCGVETPGGPTPISGAPSPNYPVLRLAKPIEAVLEMIDRLGPAAAVVRGPWPAAQAIERAGRRKLHIYFESSFLGHDFPSRAVAPTLRYAACSPFLARLAEAYVGSPVAMIPPIIAPAEYLCEPSGEAVLFVNPVAAKGVHLAAALAERLPHRRFLFVRSWPDHARAPHIAIRHANVEWVESTFDMRTLYARARLVLAPSVWEESFGRVVAEAQVSGIPSVASDRGGLREAVGDGGIVLSLADPLEVWCEAVESLFTDDRRYAACSTAAKAQAARPDHAPAGIIARFFDFISS